MSPFGVMHIVDTLETGGAERVAVNLVNQLPRERYLPYLCTTRRDGPLAQLLAPDVGRLRLNRSHRFDAGAARRLLTFIKLNNIRILHAHGTSLFLAGIASLFAPYPLVIWHDHFGRCELEDRPVWLYRIAVHRAAGVIVVNHMLAKWSRFHLSFPADRIWYIPNFVCRPGTNGGPTLLPGTAGARVVCVANLRPQKDHLTLIRALALIVQQVPATHLLIVGPATDEQYLHLLRAEISRFCLDRNVTFLGQRTDVPAILPACDIGVLASSSEGLPLALLEYGMAGLPVIATRVGQCAEVLDDGKAGILVSRSCPPELAEAVVSLIRSPKRRATLGTRLRQRVAEIYSVESAMRDVCRAYDTVLARPAFLEKGAGIQ